MKFLIGIFIAFAFTGCDSEVIGPYVELMIKWGNFADFILSLFPIIVPVVLSIVFMVKVKTNWKILKAVLIFFAFHLSIVTIIYFIVEVDMSFLEFLGKIWKL